MEKMNNTVVKFFIGFLIVLTLALLQNPHYYLFGAMHAEEAVVFYGRTNVGAKEVLLGLDCGYYPLLKNIVLYFGHFVFKLTPYVFPYYLHVVMLILVSICYFLFWTNHFSRIIKSDVLRFFICVVLLFCTFVPNTSSFLNYDYLNYWYLFWVVLYLTTIDSNQHITIKDYPAFIFFTPLFCIGKPHLLCFAPVFLYLTFFKSKNFRILLITSILAFVVSAIIIKLNFPPLYNQADQSVTFFDKLTLFFKLFSSLPAKFILPISTKLVCYFITFFLYISLSIMVVINKKYFHLLISIFILFVSYLILFSFKITPAAFTELNRITNTQPIHIFRYNVYLLNTSLLLLFFLWLFYNHIIKISFIKLFLCCGIGVLIITYHFGNWNQDPYKEENGIDWVDRASNFSSDGFQYEYVPSYIRTHLSGQTYLDIYAKNSHLAFSSFLDLNQFVTPNYENIINGTYKYDLEIDQDFNDVLSITLIGRVVGNYNHSYLSCTLIDDTASSPRLVLLGVKNIYGKKLFTLTLDHIYAGKQTIKKGTYKLICSNPMNFIKKQGSVNSVGYNIIVGN